jgi:hypothetical protein
MRSSSASFSFLLQELVEFREVRVREDRLVEVDQREPRHLDVFLLREREQQVKELALDLQDLDHLEHAAACSVDGTGPRPRARVASSPNCATFDRSTEPTRSAMSGRRRVVRRVRADADPRRFGQEHALDRHLEVVAVELALETVAAHGLGSPRISTPNMSRKSARRSSE